MATTTLIPRNRPSLEEFRAFIESLPGGYWADESGIPRGVVEAERGHVYVDYDSNYGRYFQNHLDTRRRAELLARLGGAPTVALHVEASVVDPGSDELAERIR